MDGSFAGYYVHETRMLDRLTIRVDGKALRLRSFKTDVFRARYVYTNEEQTLMVERDIVIHNGVCERLKLTPFSDVPRSEPQEWKLSVHFSADFRSMGEVRDFGPTGRGHMLNPVVTRRSVRFAWDGEDALRTTNVRFDRKPESLDAEHAVFAIRLNARESMQLEYSVDCSVGDNVYHCPSRFESASKVANRKYRDFHRSVPAIRTGSAEVNRAVKESLDGLYMLCYKANRGQCMAAGLPWYFCLFGRDICIWILQCGWMMPELAMQVLMTLSRYQSEWTDEWTEAVPGQIPHEVREDQIAMMKQIVYHHCCYAVDTAPLFIVAACQMALWTGDRKFAADIWASLKKADGCISTHTLEDYVVYTSVNRMNKFFMEEDRSVVDEHGEVPPSPKAVCDVQGFAWQARTLLARVALDFFGETQFAAAKQDEADRIQAAFQRDFWDEEMQFPVMAIGGIGGKRHPCRVFHTDALLLPPGFLTPEQEQAVAVRSRQPDLFTPWGMLPLSSAGRVFQPFFIQSQCVCPFHTVMGGVDWFLRTEMPDAAHQLIAGLLDARERIGHLPELYVVPSNSAGPLLYAASQMACYPQLWTAGAMLQALKLCSGLVIDAASGELLIQNANIPAFMGFMTIRGLRVLGAVIDLDYERDTAGNTAVTWRVRSERLRVRKAD
jgi:glycogen debranching enzyme